MRTSSGFHWYPDVPDPRDLSPDHSDVVQFLRKLKPIEETPEQSDLREWCGAVRKQSPLAINVSEACVSLIQYFERRANGTLIEPSSMFLHQVMRRLMEWNNCSGTLRTAWKAIRRFGLPDERDWPFTEKHLRAMPDAFVHASARSFKSIRYVRLDTRRRTGAEVLEIVKSYLAAGFACVLGFAVFSSMNDELGLPYPTVFDTVRGSQTAMVVGHNDRYRIRSERGALLIRNSSREDWGDQGYGWLPYAYVRERLAIDIWTLLDPAWLATEEFNRPETWTATPADRSKLTRD